MGEDTKYSLKYNSITGWFLPRKQACTLRPSTSVLDRGPTLGRSEEFTEVVKKCVLHMAHMWNWFVCTYMFSALRTFISLCLFALGGGCCSLKVYTLQCKCTFISVEVTSWDMAPRRCVFGSRRFETSTLSRKVAPGALWHDPLRKPEKLYFIRLNHERIFLCNLDVKILSDVGGDLKKW